MEAYAFKDAEDYFSKLNKKVGLLKKTDDININRYKISDNLGKGYFNYLNFGNGVELVMADFELKEDFEYEYKLLKEGFELIYCMEGNIFCGDYNLRSNVKINSNEIHFWKSNVDNEGWMKYPQNTNIKIVNVYFNEAFFEKVPYGGAQQVKKMICNNNLEQITKKLNIPVIIIPFEQIAKCNWDCDLISEILYLQSKTIEIISLFVNNESFKETDLMNQVINKEEDIKRIREAKMLISENLVNPLSIDELSKRVSLNTYKLKKGFKEVYNKTVFSCLRSMRMEKAREFLLKDNENILKIANKVGYSNSSHFAVAFRNKYGVNPSVFKKQARNL